MKDAIKNAIFGNIPFYILSGSSVLLLIASFVVPPLGIIDNSVLAATGIIFAWGALFAVVRAIDEGIDAKLQHGNTSITVGDLDKEDTVEKHREAN